MLYDPNWKKPSVQKADPFKLETLIAWLEKQPAESTYLYTNSEKCLLSQYFRAHGFRNALCGVREVTYFRWRFWIRTLPISEEMNNIAVGRCSRDIDSSGTFGAALERARNLAVK